MVSKVVVPTAPRTSTAMTPAIGLNSAAIGEIDEHARQEAADDRLDHGSAVEAGPAPDTPSRCGTAALTRAASGLSGSLEGLLRLRDLLAPCLRQLQHKDLDRRRQRDRGERAEDAQQGAEERDGDDDEEAREVAAFPWIFGVRMLFSTCW